MGQKQNFLTGLGVSALLLVSACATSPNTDSTVSDQAQTTVDDAASVAPAGPAAGSQDDLEQNVGHRVNFDFDRFDLRPDARTVLRRQAAWLRANPEVRIRVEGNCDERGTREYNLALGARRANSVKDFLVSQGVDEARIRTISYGKERPLCTQSTESCWARNRNSTTMVTRSGA